jgi:hypothetical protein
MNTADEILTLLVREKRERWGRERKREKGRGRERDRDRNRDRDTDDVTRRLA